MLPALQKTKIQHDIARSSTGVYEEWKKRRMDTRDHLVRTLEARFVRRVVDGQVCFLETEFVNRFKGHERFDRSCVRWI